MMLAIQYTIFLIAILVFFSIPGYFFWIRFKDSDEFDLEKLMFSTVVGYGLITLITYFALLLNLGFLPVIMFIFLSLYLSKKDFKQLNPKKLWPKTNYKLLSIFILSIVFQLLVIAPSGIYQNGDLVFWSSHGHDAAWHISVMNKIADGFPLENPVFAGERLVNYHYFFNIMPALFMKHLGLSPVEMYFRMFPLLFAVLLTGSSYYLGKKVGKSTRAGLWSVFFVTIAGSFGYIVTLIKNGTIGGESIFWATQPHSSIGNPPQIISNIFVLTFLYFIYDYIKNKSRFSYWICVLIAGVLAVFKVYAAVALFIPLGIISIYRFFKDKSTDLIKMTFLSGLLSVILYLPNTSGSAGFLIYEPWWYVRTMVVLDSRLDWIDMELRRQTFLAHNNYLRVLQLELTAFIIFLFGNIGVRLLGFLYFLKNYKNFYKDYFKIFLFLIVILSIILPLLFLQKGVASNTAQFLQYYVLIMSLTAGLFIDKFLTKIKIVSIKTIIVIIIILLSIPTQFGLLKDFYSRPAFAKINKEELSTLAFIKNNTDKNSIILVPAYNTNYNTDAATPQIWDWFDTSYVSAFSERSVYFADFEQMDIMGYDIESRQEVVESIFETSSIEEFIYLSELTGADYLYFPKEQKPILDLNGAGLEKVYSNEAAEIWEI